MQRGKHRSVKPKVLSILLFSLKDEVMKNALIVIPCVAVSMIFY